MKRFRKAVSRLGDLSLKVIWLLLILYLGWVLGQSVYKNYRLNARIKAIKAESQTIAQENEYLKNLIEYEKTEAFKEIELRRRLGLKKEGEKVLILPRPSPASRQSLGALPSRSSQPSRSTDSPEEAVPYYLLWYQFLFQGF